METHITTKLRITVVNEERAENEDIGNVNTSFTVARCTDYFISRYMKLAKFTDRIRLPLHGKNRSKSRRDTE